MAQGQGPCLAVATSAKAWKATACYWNAKEGEAVEVATDRACIATIAGEAGLIGRVTAATATSISSEAFAEEVASSTGVVVAS